MSQPSLPPDDIEPEAPKETPQETYDKLKKTWLTKNEKASAMFHLNMRFGGKVKAIEWKYFHVVSSVKKDAKKDDLPPNWKENHGRTVFACCNACGALVAVAKKDEKTLKPSAWRNSSMLSHLNSKDHKKITAKKLTEQIADALAASKANPKKRKAEAAQTDLMVHAEHVVSVKDRVAHQELMTTHWILDSKQAFSEVEKDSFRKMISSHNKHAKVMSNKKVKTITTNIDHAIRKASIEAMQGQSVCVTLDHWTSRRKHNYTGITGHFIDDDFKLNSRTLGMFLHKGGTKGKELEKSFLDMHREELKLDKAKLFAVTTDTTANMNKFGMLLEERGVTHVYCIDHVLQLTAKLCYDHAVATFGEAYAKSVQKARDIVTFLNNSTQALEKLKNLIKALEGKDYNKGVIADVVTRWWSTYNMIQRLLDVKAAIDSMAISKELGDKESLQPVDWENLSNIVLVLKPFKNAQEMLEGQKYVTASLVPVAINHIRRKLTQLSGSEQPETASKELAKNLLEDFEARWGGVNDHVFSSTVRRAAGNRQFGMHPALLIATFLDPRFKSLTAIDDQASRLEIKERVVEIMVDLETKNRQSTVGPPAQAQPTSQNDDEAKEPEDDGSDDGFFADLEAAAGCVEQVAIIAPVSDVCHEEIRRYEKDQGLALRERKEFNDPLKWWQMNRAKFPILAQLARVYLALPAASAPSERVFSVASKVISPTRTSLDPQMAGMSLHVCENWNWWIETVDYQKITAETEEEAKEAEQEKEK